MKNKMPILIIALVMVLCMPLTAMAAEEYNFPAGSLVIPRGSVYQGGGEDVNDGGLLEAYGLIYYLLNHRDQDCIVGCGVDEACKEACENDIVIYWVINQEKVTMDGIDLVIEVDQASLDEYGADAVAKLYDHAGGTSAIPAYRGGDPGDSNLRMTYLGGPFIIDGLDADKAKTIINASAWAAVEVHEIQVPFAALVHREMQGTPPKIALMNNDEDKTKGNAEILESYLRLAGICGDVYDILTPNEIRDGKLITGGYDFLWAPHWEGDKAPYSADNDGNGTPDVDDIVGQIATFLEAGKGLFAECASIETFEHSPNGHFLSTKGFGHNMGTNDPAFVIYNDPTGANSQIADFAYVPEGGHLHNWRPYRAGDDYKLAPLPDVSGGNSEYVATVTRFTVDDTNDNDAVDDTDWDYYVGGYAFGDTRNGYVVYLGGHKYASCSADATVGVDPDVHALQFEFAKEISTEEFTLLVKYHPGSNQMRAGASSGATEMEVDTTSGIVAGDKIGITLTNDSIHWTTVAAIIDSDTLTIVDSLPSATGVNKDVYVPAVFTKDDFTDIAGYSLEIDLTTASLDGKKKKILDVTFRNKGESTITIDSVTASWTGGAADQKLKSILDLDTDLTYYQSKEGVASGVELDMTDFTIASAFVGASPGCSDNDDCEWKNMAGVQYVLNTLFNIQFQIRSLEYVRSAPVVNHPYLYQGSFEYPSYFGHFRRYDVTDTAEERDADWDTGGIGKITNANTGNADGRKVYTAKNAGGTWSKIDFDAGSIEDLRVPLDVTPLNGDDTDELAVITRLRGKEWDSDVGAWVERENKLGAIMHSAPVIVDHNSRTGTSRTEIAYVGDLYGMLHAINIEDGVEKWAFIPPNLLGRLKNDRIDPNAVQDFAAVDGSPTAKDVYYDHDNNPETDKVWHTILVCPEGFWGNHIFALNVTDPDNWSLLWELTDTDMGHAYRAAINKVKWPVEGGYEIKWVFFVATGYASIVEAHGGINVFAYDLISGAELWHFSQGYADSVNDIPGAVTLFDIDYDTFVDRVYVGDMNGRMWEINALDGTNVNGGNIPLWNCGVGKPISVSPAISEIEGNVVVIFGTGGADWASNDQAYAVYAVDATEKQETPTYAGGAGTLLWKVDLAVGEKVWSSPTIAAGQIYIATAFGTMESSNPRRDLSVAGQPTGSLYSLKLEDGSKSWSIDNIGKTRSSLYVDRQHVNLTTMDNQVIQVGGGDFSEGNVNNVITWAWREL